MYLITVYIYLCKNNIQIPYSVCKKVRSISPGTEGRASIQTQKELLIIMIAMHHIKYIMF